jgi:transcription termination factor NusB
MEPLQAVERAILRLAALNSTARTDGPPTTNDSLKAEVAGHVAPY